MKSEISPFLFKKFSIGISLSLELEEYAKLIESYGQYIYDIYFSLPLGDIFHSRVTVAEEYSKPGALNKFLNILRYVKSKGIKLELALNTYYMSSEHIARGIDFINSKVEVDSVVTLSEYGLEIKKRFPGKRIIFSYNNGIRTKSDIDKVGDIFDEIVLGNSSIRNLDMFSYAKSKNFRTKLLLNNGCSFNCSWCRRADLCKPTFLKNLEKSSAEELFALQSIFPWELHKHLLLPDIIDVYKISNRPCTYDYLDKCLYSYINNYDRPLIEENYKNYYLWGRLGKFSPYYKTFQFDRINQYKELIWNKNIQNIL